MERYRRYRGFESKIARLNEYQLQLVSLLPLDDKYVCSSRNVIREFLEQTTQKYAFYGYSNEGTKYSLYRSQDMKIYIVHGIKPYTDFHGTTYCDRFYYLKQHHLDYLFDYNDVPQLETKGDFLPMLSFISSWHTSLFGTQWWWSKTQWVTTPCFANCKKSLFNIIRSFGAIMWKNKN
jgi:hypothetical protein